MLGAKGILLLFSVMAFTEFEHFLSLSSVIFPSVDTAYTFEVLSHFTIDINTFLKCRPPMQYNKKLMELFIYSKHREHVIQRLVEEL